MPQACCSGHLHGACLPGTARCCGLMQMTLHCPSRHLHICSVGAALMAVGASCKLSEEPAGLLLVLMLLLHQQQPQQQQQQQQQQQ
jgi:hypothetical protein